MRSPRDFIRLVGLAAALFASPAGALAATTVTGTIKDAAGNALANGTIEFKLSQEGIVTDPALLLQQPVVTCTITTGVIQSCSLRGNDEISPAGTVYKVKIFDADGITFLPERTYSITGATWDIGQQAPNPSSVQDGIHGASLHSGDVIPPANQEFGAFYSDFSQIAAPADPASGTRRLFVDSGTGELSVRTSAGVTVSLEGSGGGSGDITDVGDCATGACFQSVAANQVFAAPDGSAGQAAFRALVDADFPSSNALDSELHAQAHVLATTAGLGADHTTSGLTPGQVLRATAAGAAAFQSLQAGDLPTHDVACASNPCVDDVEIVDAIARDSELHAQTHALSGSDHTASGLTIGYVVRATAATTFAWQQLGFSDLSGSATDAQVPNTITLDNLTQITTRNYSDLQNRSHGAADHTGDAIPGANQDFGAFYSDFGEIAAPANPAAGVVRVYAKTGSGELCSRDSAGTENCMSTGAGGANHNILSSTHSDTTAAAVVRGDLMTGQLATPKWQRLAIGGANTFLGSDGTDATWTGLVLAGAQFANQGSTTQVLHGNAAGNPSWAAVSLTADVSGVLPGANGGTNNAFVAFTGPATSLKTFTLPNASSTILTDNALVTVAQGGTGLTSGTSGGIPYFNATSTMASSTLLTANALVLGGGAGAAPSTPVGLGTTTTLLHGNAGGAPSYSAVDLANDVTGALAAGSYGAATIDGDDLLGSSVGGVGLTLTPGAPDTLDCDVASATAVGCPELATVTETDTGTDTGRAVTPDGLAGSVFGQVDVQMVLFDFTTAVATGDGKFYFHIATGSKLIGMDLIDVIGSVITVSSSGAITVDVARCAPVATGNLCSGTVADVLSTNLTIDANEDSSDTAATDAVIAGASDDVIADQTWRIDVDGAGTGTQGLIVTLIFQLP